MLYAKWYIACKAVHVRDNVVMHCSVVRRGTSRIVVGFSAVRRWSSIVYEAR